MSTATQTRARWLILLVPVLGLVLALQLLGDDAIGHPERAAIRADAASAEPLPRGRATSGPVLPDPLSVSLRAAPGASGRDGTSSDLAQEAAASVPPTHIEGVVLDGDRRALPGVRVSLHALLDARTPKRSPLLEVTADPRGGFRLAPVPAGTFAVWAEAEGHAPAWRTGLAAGTRVALTLEAGGRLSVTARDEAGRGIEGASVRVGRPGYFRDGTTDARGRAEMACLPGGPAELRVATRAGALHVQTVRIDPHAPQQVTCTLAAASTLRGRVRERDTARGIDGAQVRLHLVDHPDLVAAETHTDANGAFELPAPRAAGIRLEVRASKEGFADGVAPLLPTRTGAEVGPVAITLWPQRRLEGVVVDAQGYPVAGAQVWWPAEGAPDPEGAGTAVATRRGRFRIALPAGATDRGGRPLAARASHGRFGATVVHLENPAAEIRVIVRGAGRLTGTLTDEGSRPVRAALVGLEPSSLGPTPFAASAEDASSRRQALASLDPASLRVVSGEDGGYHFPAVPAGAWRVRVTHEAGTLVVPDEIVVPEGEVRTLHITVPAPSTISGEVIATDGSPLRGAHVLATSTAGMEAAVCDGRGRFALEDLDGRVAWTLLASARGHASERLDSVFTGGRGLRIVLSDRPAIRGTVTRDGRAYDDVFRIRLLPARQVDVAGGGAIGSVPLDDRSWAGRTFVDSEGAFEVELPDDRAYVIQAVSRDGTLASVLCPLSYSHEGLTLALEPAGGARGHVETAGGLPAPDAVVTVHAYVDGGLVAHPVASTRTDAKGAYVLDALPAGVYRLRAAGAAGQSARDITLPNARELTIRL